jgi:hypothetical protein
MGGHQRVSLLCCGQPVGAGPEDRDPWDQGGSGAGGAAPWAASRRPKIAVGDLKLAMEYVGMLCLRITSLLVPPDTKWDVITTTPGGQSVRSKRGSSGFAYGGRHSRHWGCNPQGR